MIALAEPFELGRALVKSHIERYSVTYPVPLGVEEDDPVCMGLPRERDRSRRVRMMYSLLHVAKAVRRQKALLSVRKLSILGATSVTVPGKKRAKAALQA